MPRTGRYKAAYAANELSRRRFLAALSVATVAGVGLARCAVGRQPPTVAQAANASPAPAAAGSAGLLPPPPPVARVPLPGGGVISTLPGHGDLLALTLDDGVSSDVVRLYTQFAKDTGLRLTYFVNGSYKSWRENVGLLRPVVEAGQIQLGNHTWSHPDLTTVPKSRVADELVRNHQFLMQTYGIDARPYFRPPYGNRDATVDAVAADLGYATATLWSGSLSDEVVIPQGTIVKMAEKYFTPQTIVIGHLNHRPVTHVYADLLDIIRARGLRTVTLDDVFFKPRL